MSEYYVCKSFEFRLGVTKILASNYNFLHQILSEVDYCFYVIPTYYRWSSIKEFNKSTNAKR